MQADEPSHKLATQYPPHPRIVLSLAMIPVAIAAMIAAIMIVESISWTWGGPSFWREMGYCTAITVPTVVWLLGVEAVWWTAVTWTGRRLAAVVIAHGIYSGAVLLVLVTCAWWGADDYGSEGVPIAFAINSALAGGMLTAFAALTWSPPIDHTRRHVPCPQCHHDLAGQRTCTCPACGHTASLGELDRASQVADALNLDSTPREEPA